MGKMDFTYQELARLMAMIGVALMSGEIQMYELSKSIHKKVTDEIVKKNEADLLENV